MQIKGTLKKVQYRDDLTGYTGFFFELSEKSMDTIFLSVGTVVFCVGVIPCYSPETSLVLDGEYKEDDRFYVSFSSLSSSLSLLSSIKGIGEEKIKKIQKVIKEESIFSFVKRGDAKEKLCTVLCEKEAEKIIKKVSATSAMQELFEYVIDHGGTYANAAAVFKKYNEKSLEKIKENPFELIDYGFTFAVCEKIGQENNFDINDRRRLSALVKTAFNTAANMGHVYMLFDSLFAIVRRTETLYSTEPFWIGYILLKEKGRYVIEEERIYRRCDYNKELNAAKNLSRIVKTAKTLPAEELDMDTLQKDCAIKFDKEQLEAFTLLKTTGVKMLTGGPGTGKTATMKGMVAAFRSLVPGAKVSLCAPTANAAKRLRESTGEDAFTVHKLLNVRPFGDEIDHIKELDSDFIIVDEASMIDIELLDILVSAVRNGALLLFVGDEDQLPSVGQGNVFHDLLDSSAIEKVRLKTIHRQNEKCSIVENSIRIKSGCTSLLQDENSKIIYSRDMQADIIKEVEKYYDSKKPWKTKVYSPVKLQKYDVGTRVLNRRLHAIYNPDNAELIRGGQIFAKGDPVIMTRNNYETGYCNGDEGIVEAVIDGSLLINIEDKTLEIKGKDLEDVELAYVLTTHKAQGSECENAIIIVPQKPACMLTRSLVYVAGTRAKKKNVFIVEGNALRKAISNVKKISRNTSLTERLNKICS